jgi:hypothetical protein
VSASRTLKRIAVPLILIGVGFFIAGALAELVLRVAPIPGITYHTFYFDSLTGERYYPNTTFIYRNERGDHVRRRVNRWGYLDVNHDVEKPDGVVRIGFFGDSFTEARQVPQDTTFERRIEHALNARGDATRYECIAIAMAGFSTTQAYLECRRWMHKLSLDHVIYVFCENDPGNNVPSLNMSDAVPYPALVRDSLTIDDSFAAHYANKRRFPHRVWQFLKSHTLLFSTLETRWHLLRSHGIKTHVGEAERFMEMPTDRSAPISANSPPSVLPDSIRTLCETLTGRVLLAWKRAVDTEGATFDILYVPRRGEMEKPLDAQDSWAPWLTSFCRAHDIGFIDPSRRFVRAEDGGKEIFYDHLTSDGHAEMAAAFLDQFKTR